MSASAVESRSTTVNVSEGSRACLTTVRAGHEELDVGILARHRHGSAAVVVDRGGRPVARLLDAVDNPCKPRPPIRRRHGEDDRDHACRADDHRDKQNAPSHDLILQSERSDRMPGTLRVPQKVSTTSPGTHKPISGRPDRWLPLRTPLAPRNPSPRLKAVSSSKPAGRCSPSVGRFDSCAAPLDRIQHGCA
jgi:hypothetical protein